MFFSHTDVENYAREVLQEQLRQGWKGLAQEVVEICQKKIGLPNACLEYVHREERSSESFKGRIQNVCVCVYPFSREGGINLFGDHRGSILSNRAEISQDG